MNVSITLTQATVFAAAALGISLAVPRLPMGATHSANVRRVLAECVATKCAVTDLEAVIGEAEARQFAAGREYRLYHPPIEFDKRLKVVARVGRGGRIDEIKVNGAVVTRP